METLRHADLEGDPASGRTALAGNGKPLSITLPLPARAASVPVARAHLFSALAAWKVTSPDVCDDAGLVLSELTANAVSAACETAIPLILVRVSYAAGALLIEVTDPCPGAPPALTPHASADAESGRGLQIVTALASRWGCYPLGAWKCVWAHIPAGHPSSTGTAVRAGNVGRAA